MRSTANTDNKDLIDAKLSTLPFFVKVDLGIPCLLLVVFWLSAERGTGWGDGGLYAIMASNLTLGTSTLHHPLYMVLGHLASFLPLGHPAVGINMMSGFFGACAIGVLLQILRELEIRRTVRAFTGIAAGLGHTFWLHSVITEVYTLNAFFYLLFIWAGITWIRSPKLAWSFLMGAAIGLGASNHRMILLNGPIAFLATVLIPGSTKNKIQAAAIFLLGCVIGDALDFYLFLTLPPDPAGAASTLAGGSFIKEMFSIGPSTLIKGALKFAAFLFYQYPLAGFLLIGFGNWKLWQNNRKILLFLAASIALNIIFFINYSVKDQYVFYIPVYLVSAVFIGVGLQSLPLPLSRIMGVTMVLLPLLTYTCVPLVALNSPQLLSPLAVKEHRTKISFIRRIPFREDINYFLLPPKLGGSGAEKFSASTWETLPTDAKIIADWSPGTPLLYDQQVRGIRRDVNIYVDMPRDKQIELARSASAKHPVYLATDEERYYPIAEIQAFADLVPDGLIYRIKVRTP